MDVDKALKEKIHRSYLISIYNDKSDKPEKFYAIGRNFLGQTNPPEGVFELPTFRDFGDDIDQLIDNLKAKIDLHFDE